MVVLGHTGGTFCAGADLAQAAGNSEQRRKSSRKLAPAR